MHDDRHKSSNISLENPTLWIRHNDTIEPRYYSLSERSSCGAVWLAAAAAPYAEEKGAASSVGSSGTETRPPPARWCALAAGKNSISLTSFFAGGSAKGASPCAVIMRLHRSVCDFDRVKLASFTRRQRESTFFFCAGARVRVHERTMSGHATKYTYLASGSHGCGKVVDGVVWRRRRRQRQCSSVVLCQCSHPL